MKVVVDTNLWISFLLHGKVYKSVLDIISRRDVLLVLTKYSIDELVSVASRPKFAKYIPQEALNAFVDFLLENGEFYTLLEIPKRCRDPKDDYLLELASIAGADFILSGDDDLLSLHHIGSCRIIRLSDFQILKEYAGTLNEPRRILMFNLTFNSNLMDASRYPNRVR